MRLQYNDQSHSYWLDGKRCKSVTTVAKIPQDTYRLEQWATRMVALGMALSPHLGEQAAAHYDDRDQLNRIADEAKMAAQAHVAAGRGSAAHRITERVDLEQPVIDTPLSLAVVAAWGETLDAAGLEIVPEYVERIVVYPELKVAGRFDRLARRKTDGRLVVVDLKTGENAVRFPHEIATQLALYANAPLMAGPIPPGGGTTEQFEPLPGELDRDVGIIVHMPSEGQTKAVLVDIAAGWQIVTRAVLPILTWRARTDLVQEIPAFGDSVVSEPAAGRDGPGLITPDPSTNPDPAHVTWLHDRVKTILAYSPEAAALLADLWSIDPTIPTFKNGGPQTLEHCAAIATMCDSVETEFGMPFGPPDPTAPAVTKQTIPTRERA